MARSQSDNTSSSLTRDTLFLPVSLSFIAQGGRPFSPVYITLILCLFGQRYSSILPTEYCYLGFDFCTYLSTIQQRACPRVRAGSHTLYTVCTWGRFSSRQRPIARAEAKPILEAPLVDTINLINKFSLEDEIPSESVPAEPVRLEATFRVDSTTTSTNNPSGFENPFEHTPLRSPTIDFSDSEEDLMSYPYPRYNGEADAEAHIRAYLTTWQANHASKRLGLVEANISKIAEFGLSLDGQAASWYSQNEISEFADFDQLKQEFVQLFHRRIPQRDLMSQFYAIRQEANETVPQFVIRFQSLRRQLTRSPTPEELTEIFLTGLREPLRTMLQLMDLSGQPTEEVIRRVLHLDSAQSMSMTSLQEALPTTEETRFRQAIQCTTCLNPGHSALECTLQMHCPIFHSRAHTLELCEYNLLNRNAATVRQIEPQATQTANTTPRQAPRESERPRPRDRYRDDNRDWEEEDYHEDV